MSTLKLSATPSGVPTVNATGQAATILAWGLAIAAVVYAYQQAQLPVEQRHETLKRYLYAA